MKLEQIISTKLKQPVVIVDSYVDEGDISGKFFHSGQVYDYRIRKDTILEYYRNDSDTSYVDGYSNARLQQLGLETTNENPYEYMQGAVFQLNQRMDDKCKTGTACGGICLPPGKKCTLGARLQHATLTAKQNALGNQEKNLQDRHKTLGKIIDHGLKGNVAIGATGGTVAGGLIGHSTTTQTLPETSSALVRGKARSALAGAGSTQRHTAVGAAAGGVAGAALGAANYHGAKSEKRSVEKKLGKIQSKKQQLAVKRQRLIDKTPDR